MTLYLTILTITTATLAAIVAMLQHLRLTAPAKKERVL